MKDLDIKVKKIYGLHRSSGKGAYGTYYKINNEIGVKVLYDGTLKEAQKEAKLLNRAHAAGIAPRCHEIIITFDKQSRPKVALVVDHIDGPACGESLSPQAMKEIKKALATVGIRNRDLENGPNIRRSKKGPKVVDFSADQCHLIKKTKG